MLTIHFQLWMLIILTKTMKIQLKIKIIVKILEIMMKLIIEMKI